MTAFFLQMFPSFSRYYSGNQSVCDAKSLRQVYLQHPVFIRFSNLYNVLLSKFRHRTSRPALVLLKTTPIRVNLVLALSGVLKVSCRIIQLVTIFVVDGLSWWANSNERFGYQPVNRKLLSVWHSISREGNASITAVTGKGRFEPVVSTPPSLQSFNLSHVADFVQTFISFYWFPHFHNNRLLVGEL